MSVPIVFRGPNGAAAGVGAQHSHVCFRWLYFCTDCPNALYDAACLGFISQYKGDKHVPMLYIIIIIILIFCFIAVLCFMVCLLPWVESVVPILI